MLYLKNILLIHDQSICPLSFYIKGVMKITVCNDSSNNLYSNKMNGLSNKRRAKMKHIGWWVISVFLFISTLALATERTVYVNFPSVNIRAEAGTKYKVIESVTIGHPLKVLDVQDEWYQVKLEDNTIGWVYKTMVSDEIPPVVRIEQLETKLKGQAAEFKEARIQLQAQTDLNSKLDKKLGEIQQEYDKAVRKNKELERQVHIKLAGIGIGILFLGWIAGFVTGFFKRQAEDKRFVKMMIEANSLKKP